MSESSATDTPRSPFSELPVPSSPPSVDQSSNGKRKSEDPAEECLCSGEGGGRKNENRKKFKFDPKPILKRPAASLEDDNGETLQSQKRCKFANDVQVRVVHIPEPTEGNESEKDDDKKYHECVVEEGLALHEEGFRAELTMLPDHEDVRRMLSQAKADTTSEWHTEKWGPRGTLDRLEGDISNIDRQQRRDLERCEKIIEQKFLWDKRRAEEMQAIEKKWNDQKADQNAEMSQEVIEEGEKMIGDIKRYRKQANDANDRQFAKAIDRIDDMMKGRQNRRKRKEQESRKMRAARDRKDKDR
ncbi:hypothetical protein BG004_001913 [Podila humilis]|nr:hypothetical protein BG004_001913 [Podila humilis]